MKNRIEDNETLKRALLLAGTGDYRTTNHVVQKLIDEKRLRVNELLLMDEFMRGRIEDLCLKNRPPRR